MVKHGKATKATKATKPGWKTKQNQKKNSPPSKILGFQSVVSFSFSARSGMDQQKI